MEHVRWIADPDRLPITRPVMLAAFTGWNDAGDAASTAIRTLIESADAQPLAEIDPEPYTDFATVRPHVRLDAQRNRTIVWPTTGVWWAALPGADVILVLGPEPALRWRSFCEQLTGIAQRVGVTMAITVGALLADVPHTRPTQLIGTASDDVMLDRFSLERSRYEGPTGIVGVLYVSLQAAGLPTASLWAAVPGYASQLPSPRAAIALVERACSMIGAPAPIAALATEVADYDARVAALIADDDDLVTYVGRLEEMLDEAVDADQSLADDFESVDDDYPGESLGSLDPDGGLVDDPEALVDEVERFLRDRQSE